MYIARLCCDCEAIKESKQNYSHQLYGIVTVKLRVKEEKDMETSPDFYATE